MDYVLSEDFIKNVGDYKTKIKELQSRLESSRQHHQSAVAELEKSRQRVAELEDMLAERRDESANYKYRNISYDRLIQINELNCADMQTARLERDVYAKEVAAFAEANTVCQTRLERLRRVNAALRGQITSLKKQVPKKQPNPRREPQPQTVLVESLPAWQL